MQYNKNTYRFKGELPGGLNKIISDKGGFFNDMFKNQKMFFN